MATTDYISYTFALLVLFGGLTGYLKKGSLQSLTAGLVFSAMLAYGASRSSANNKDVGVLMLTSLILALVMGIRFVMAGYFKFMPAGLVFLLSVASFCRNAYIFKQS